MIDFFNRIEIGSSALWSWLPETFEYKAVNMGAGLLATEYGMFWLGMRLSYYSNPSPRTTYLERNGY